MKPKMILKIIVDIAMTVALIFLMAYSLIGEAAHEWIGTSMFVLFILHHTLNGKWWKSILKGKYTAMRVWQTALVIGILLCMSGSMVSGIVLSNYVFNFLSIRSGQSWARTLHLLSAYWGLVLMSLHLGFHWSMMMGLAKKRFGASSRLFTWGLRAATAGIAAYGIYSFVQREIGSYMFRKSEFVFFNFEEPLIFFLLDYVSIIGLFVCVGHYFTVLLKAHSRKRKRI